MAESKFEIFEKRDEDQILAEAQGHIIEEMFYKFPLDGKTVTGISWVGTKEIARKYGGIKMGIPQVTDLGDQYACSIQATDTKNDVTLIGSSMQPKNMTLKNGEEKPDRFAYTKVVSKAQRNAIRALIPETFLLEMEKTFSSGSYKQGSKPAPRYEEAEQPEHPSVPVRPDGNEILGYLEECGYKAEQFTVWEDMPEQIICIKPLAYMGTQKWKDEMRELGAVYRKEDKVYVVHM